MQCWFVVHVRLNIAPFSCKVKHRGLENVQKKSHKATHRIYSLDMRNFNLSTLSYLRNMGDMIEVFKITYGIYDKDATICFCFFK